MTGSAASDAAAVGSGPARSSRSTTTRRSTRRSARRMPGRVVTITRTGSRRCAGRATAGSTPGGGTGRRRCSSFNSKSPEPRRDETPEPPSRYSGVSKPGRRMGKRSCGTDERRSVLGAPILFAGARGSNPSACRSPVVRSALVERRAAVPDSAGPFPHRCISEVRGRRRRPTFSDFTRLTVQAPYTSRCSMRAGRCPEGAASSAFIQESPGEKRAGSFRVLCIPGRGR